MRTVWAVPMFAMLFASTGTTHAVVPGGIDVVCDVPRSGSPNFRSAATGQTSVKFKLWSASTGGTQIGSDYDVPMADLIVAKRYTDRYDSVARRRAMRINATIGDDGSPVVLPANGQAWLEVMVGVTTLGCDYAATANVAARGRLQTAPFAQKSDHSASCDTCQTLAPTTRSYVEAFIPPDVNQGPLPYNTTTRVDFSNVSQDALGEWNATTKEFTAQQSGTYLVHTTVLFSTTLVDGKTYFLAINSDNDSAIAVTKSYYFVQASGGPDVSAHLSATLRLSAGKKIWVTVDHNSSSVLPSLYWRDYNTNVRIARID